MKKTVVFDFDGVIHSYTSGWKGIDVISDEPVEGIREAIFDIRNAGYEVVIVSTRSSSPEGYAAISDYLDKHGIVVDSITMEKPPAIVYIDDRAICFDGDTRFLLNKIEAFEPWHQKKGISSKEWEDAENYLNLMIAEYASLGTAGRFGLELTLLPLKKRYDDEERSNELYHEIMDLE